MRYVAVVVVLLGCGKRASEPTAGSASGSGSPVSVGSGSGRVVEPMADENPTVAVVKAAFGGNVPAFPQLSKDGNTAAVELDTQVGLTSATTYAVAFVGTAGAPVASTLVDGRLAQVLLEGSSAPGKPAAIDTAALAKTAGSITRRLQDEGFSAFEHKIEEVAPGEPIAAGPAKLSLAEADDGSLAITVIDDKGKQVTKDAIKPVDMGKVADLECVSQPIARHAWFDTARRRVLVEVGWNAGPDQCNAPDALYRLYAVP